MAHIALDARKYFDFGIGRYIQSLVTGFSSSGDGHAFTLFVSEQDMTRIQTAPNLQIIPVPFRKYSIAELTQFRNKVSYYGVDLFHEPHFTLPLGLKRRSIVTIHDLIHLKLPQFFNLPKRLYAREMIRHAVQHSGMILTVSKRSKEDIQDLFSVPEERIAVIYNGVGKEFTSIVDRYKLADFRLRYGLEKPFILYVGNVKPHKNIPRLLNAFSKLRSDHPDLLLVIVGGSLALDAESGSLIASQKLTTSIRELGPVSTEDLVLAYQASHLLVLPSLYEGFGFPIVEAMACGTPVVCSDGGSLPEIAGDAALIVSKESVEELTEAMRRVLEEKDLRTELIRKGFLNIQRFSWEQTVRETLKIYSLMLNRT